MTIQYEEVKKILSGVQDSDKVLEYIDELLDHMSDVEDELITMITASKGLAAGI